MVYCKFEKYHGTSESQAPLRVTLDLENLKSNLEEKINSKSLEDVNKVTEQVAKYAIKSKQIRLSVSI